MAVEPHPYPESALWRVGSPVVAVILAAVVFAAMLTLTPGSALVTIVVSAGVLQLVLMIGRGLYLRREGRLADLHVRWHQFAFLWSTFSGGTYLLGGENSTMSAAIYVGTGLFFALLMLGAFRLLDRTVVQR